MLRISNNITLLALAISAASLAGCGGDSSEPGAVLLTCNVPMVPDAAGTRCVAPEPISCPAPTVPDDNNEQCVVGADPTLPAPVFTPAADQSVIYYNNVQDADNSANDPVYDGYRLHTWNNETCDAYAAPFDTSDWANGHEFDGIDPNYGAYWIVNLKEGYGDCGNFIIHIGTEGSGKALGDGDLSMPLMQDDETFVRMNFTLHGEPSVFEYPILSLGVQPLSISGMGAHWLDTETIIWNQDDAEISSVKLHYAINGDLTVEAEPDRIINSESVTLTAVELSDAQKALVPHMAGWKAYSTDLTAEQVKDIVKAQLVVAAHNGDDVPVAATFVQAAKVLDALYTAGENDADEAMLGLDYNDSGITAAVWAPTAQALKLNIYNADKSLNRSEAMNVDTMTGIWSYTGDMSLDRLFYRFEITVYHPLTKQIETIEATDPYSVNVSTNGRYSQFVNLNDDDLKPEGWDDHPVATITNPEDAVIYEGHVRDFSIRDESTSVENRGKYLAFTEEGTAPVEHLKKLVANGLTHFHVLPVTDIASINEDSAERIELTDTLAMLCDKIEDAADACTTQDKSATIETILADTLSGSADAQAIVEAMREFDGFNWGYDPHHFMAPEGSYASTSEGVARVVELRAMNKSLHDMGLRVVLDVVYNHTSSSGLWDNSVLDKLVPGYYHRYNEESGLIERSTCCENTATEHRMMDKFVSDTMVVLAKDYGFDSFRFDVMGHMPKQSILNARSAVQAVDPDNYFYGEGWNFGEVADNRLFEQATQANMAGSEVGTFNDRIRESVRSGNLFKVDASDDALRDQDTLRLSMAGNLQNYILKDFNGNSAKGSSYSWNSQPTAYTLDPADSINYVSKHDNETLWDNLQYKNPIGMSLAERVRVQNIAITLPLLSQGIPFLQMGADLLRSKSMDRNSYDSGDWFNWVDFTKSSHNWNVGLPREQDNGIKWDEIAGISANPNAAASMSEIEMASNVFNEFLTIRSHSPLFRLTTAAEIIERVGFHNVGKRQTQGVIVMSLDDGAGLADLDSSVDALVVMINASANEVSHTIPTAAGFELHPTLIASVDSMVASASFNAGEGEGSFTVPAFTTAVFVKPQGDTQGVGLLANATVGAPDVVPFGSTGVFVRGGMNDWGETDLFTYVGDGEYRIAITLAAGDYEFKIASADWSSVDFGGLSASEAQVEENVDESLTRSGANLHFNAAIDATYVFSFNAADKEAPVLNIYNEEPFVGTEVFVRGAMNGWGTDDAFTYMGGGVYRADISLAAGSHEFKVASDDWSTVDYGSAESDAAVTLDVAELLAISGANMTFEADEATSYAFVFDASNRDEITLAIFKADMFAGNTVYVRGGMNGWGEVDAFSYQGMSVYTVDIALEVGDNEFKVATGDWSTVDLGAATEQEDISLDMVQTLASKGANMHLDVTEAGTYRFTLTGPDPKAPKLSVNKVN
ncbi:pullulanase-type alpha-1,6-glucosidase [Shewanella sp. KX20019]|uniref:pullulanase-type alpha-1,6-glucosidase n=1 Tax=Shewanella sp. KX20019 TaxID=2803864 RepID=UPI001929204E|nr:pullulanase-type alpha-1,6-glucosidase [Shewanella sp. KX20019]QQX78937.1 pullulanase-type alpha-1,6-glucosidase [Shewanella sp. KX20019]